MNGYHNGSSALLDAKEETSDMKHHSSSAAKHKHKDKERRKETEEERRIRKEKERREKEKKYRKEGKRPETEEERRIRKEKERKDKEERRKKEGKGREETEEERQLRKEKERKEKEERYRKEGKRPETEEERRARKERERKEREEGKSKHRKESDDERRSRKDKERKAKPDVKVEPTSDDDEENSPLACRPSQSAVQPIKSEPMEEDDEDVPITKSSKRSQKRKSAFDDEDEDEEGHGEDNEDADYHSDDYAPPSRKKIKEEIDDEEGDDDFKPSKKKSKAVASKKPAAPKKPAAKSKKGGAIKVEPASAPSSPVKGAKKVKKEEQDVKVWKWWEEEKTDDGTKWKFLEHKGPLFAPLYERLPENVRFMYDKQPMRLSDDAEEIATFYGKMLDHDYTTKEVFNKNFFKDWRKSMTDKEREKIRDLSKCDFSEINFYFKQVSEQRKARSKEERKAEKERNDAIQKEYGIAVIDGHEEKIGNFRIEPPGLFRGRGEHPKQGMVKRRVQPEDVTINCSKNSKWPQPPDGHKWKEVRHDNTVTWLASWTENIQNQIKYVMLNPSSRLKGEKDMEKYDKARKLKVKIDKIREDYTNDFKSKEMRVRQRAVALYFIDKLALRAGNEKDEDQADTVGCCSLRIEHITLHPIHEGKEHVVEFDFLGKDSIRYHNYVQVEKRVFKNLQLFKENKKVGDDLFDRLNTSILNDYLSNLMPGLTAKVFRTYNASITLQEQLALLTESDDNIPAKMLSYNRANRAVAVLCNHQRAVPKTHETSMKNLQDKIDKKKQELDEAEKQYKAVKKASKGKNSAGEVEKKMKAVKRIMEQLNRLETQKTDKEENKQIALGTSKLNYLDPRITVAWCKKFGVPIEKVYNKTQREKFRWAIDMTEEDYIF